VITKPVRVAVRRIALLLFAYLIYYKQHGLFHDMESRYTVPSILLGGICPECTKVIPLTARQGDFGVQILVCHIIIFGWRSEPARKCGTVRRLNTCLGL
jgi:hypothetical protein